MVVNWGDKGSQGKIVETCLILKHIVFIKYAEEACGKTTSKASLDNAVCRLEDNDLSNRLEMKLCALD